MGFRRKRTPLTGLEIHHVSPLPLHIAFAVMLENLFPTFAQHRQGDTKAAIRRLRAGNGLEQEVYRCAKTQCGSWLPMCARQQICVGIL